MTPASNQIALRDEGPVFGGGWLPFASLILLAVGVFAGFKVLKTDAKAGLAIIAASALPAAVVGLQVARLFKKIGRAQLMVNDELVPIGWSGTLTYVRPLRGGAALRAIDGRLQCEEHVTRGSGRNRREWRQVVADEPIAPYPAPMPNELRVQIPIKIPAAGPPSFEYVDNEIIWWVRLRLEMEGCPNTRSSFRIRVAPAVK